MGEAQHYVVCLATTPTERAREIAAAIVETRLVACVNIVPVVESIYRWKDNVERDQESLLVIKTTQPAVEPMIEAIRVLHPYENFELVALNIEAGSQEYLRWIADSVNVAGAERPDGPPSP